MDVKWFLMQRTEFLRFYYTTAARAFLDVQRKIEVKEAPYDDLLYDESGDPPYLEEWNAAEDGLDVLGRSCVSTLSATIQLYFEEWVKELRIRLDDRDRMVFKKGGVLAGYRNIFEVLLSRPWTDCPADLGILEQVTLARNNDQHSSSISTVHAYHREIDRQKFPDLFFLSDADRRQLGADPDNAGLFFFSNQVSVTRDQLFDAIDQLERLAEWLEPQLVEFGHRLVPGG